MIAFACLYLLISGVPGVLAPQDNPAPLWDNDILIWDMSENSTWAGPGLTYCTGIFDLEGKQYAASIIDSTGTQGNVIKIFSSVDGGYNWILENWITGATWLLTDPELVLNSTASSDYLIVGFTGSSATGTLPYGIRYTLPNFIFDAFLMPDWPSSDTLKSMEMISHPDTDELWMFGDNNDHNIYMTRSTDNGDNWTTAELVASDAILPSAAAGPSGWVYLTYRRISDNMIISVAFSETSYFETEVADGGDTSAPIVTSEKAGSGVVSIIYHDQNYDIRMALSTDNGAHWAVSSAISKGYYPFIDVMDYSRRCALAFIDFTTQNIYYSSAANLEALPTVSPIVVSDQSVFMGGPPVIRHGGLTSGVSLFYMSPGTGGPEPQDLWFDNSLHTQSNPEPELSGDIFSMGPNPFTSCLSIEFSFTEPGECALDLYSMDGRLVESIYSGVTSRETVQIGEELPVGIYSVVLRTGDTLTTRRVVKL
ncbi:MAG: T9SS type A sorting domain-containing protein [Candidatus Aegiribacteria sp.]|nr:T9SS type A sorting domain-containing protein [Candidatus Aegiribacteria sp.]